MTNPNRVLIIDDEAEIRAFFSDVAEETGFLSAEAENNAAFAKVYDEFDPSVIILDLTMPDTDGVEFLRELAKRECKAPVIVASGKDERVLSTAQRLGRMFGLTMQGVLQKPVDIGALEAALEEVKIAFAEETPSWRPSPEGLGEAITAGELTVYFQPKVDLQSDGFQIIGSEALVRWRHPTQGVISPDAFLAMAEEADLIGRLTDVVFSYVVKQLQSWQRQGVAKPVSVNLSPTQLTDLTLPDKIAGLLDKAGLDPSLLIVEVTEQAALENVEVATDILTRLRLKEIAVSLDDFGAGYSSLIEVYRLPLSELKLDRSLITDIENDEGARTVVKAIFAMARELKLTVCVEGVETIRAARLLQSFGCEKGQGYYFSEPVPAETFTQLLTQPATDKDARVVSVDPKSFQRKVLEQNEFDAAAKQ